LVSREITESLYPGISKFNIDTSKGPDALSVTDPATVAAIHSPDSKCIKGSFYSIAEPQRNLLMIRQKAEHAKKRRVWDRAFNVKCELYGVASDTHH